MRKCGRFFDFARAALERCLVQPGQCVIANRSKLYHVVTGNRLLLRQIITQRFEIPVYAVSISNKKLQMCVICITAADHANSSASLDMLTRAYHY